jgi:fructuronate reductase
VELVSSAMQLGEATLARLDAEVRRPPMPRPPAGIVHLGLGAFHRAHMAVYTEDAEALAPGGWGIAGVTMRTPALRDVLRAQDRLYSVIERDAAGDRARVVGVLAEALTAALEPQRVVERIAAPTTRIVSLTVTEKGYALNPTTRELRLDAPEIAADLAATRSGAVPQTPVGLLVAGFAARRRAEASGVTVLCCDNLPSNGAVLHRAALRFAEARGDGLADWIDRHVSFPSTMVDRIVPAVTEADRQLAAERLGVEDMAPVVTEPFTQWVIEDDFVAGRPTWDQVGVTMVADVAPYETMKLRLLNGSHSAIAYLGRLAGWDTVAEAMRQPAMAAYVAALMQECAATFAAPRELDLAAYRRSLLVRFANPTLPHRTVQIAVDGSQKLPQRLFAPALVRARSGRPAPRIALGIAAWLHYLRGCTEAGERLVIDDPIAERLGEAAAESGGNADLVARIFRMADVVPPALAALLLFRSEVLAALDRLTSLGVRATLAAELS